MRSCNDEEFDLLGEMGAIGGYESVVADSTILELGSVQVRVLSLEHLIATKEAANRPKDLLVLPLLKETLAMRNAAAKPPPS